MTQPRRQRVRKPPVLLLAQTFVAARCTGANSEFLYRYLKGVKEQLAVHADLPAQSFERVGHPNKDDIVDAKHQHQHEGRLGQFSVKRHTHTHTSRTRCENNHKISVSLGICCILRLRPVVSFVQWPFQGCICLFKPINCESGWSELFYNINCIWLSFISNKTNHNNNS